jgi:hypothetical protein
MSRIVAKSSASVFQEGRGRCGLEYGKTTTNMAFPLFRTLVAYREKTDDYGRLLNPSVHFSIVRQTLALVHSDETFQVSRRLLT